VTDPHSLQPAGPFRRLDGKANYFQLTKKRITFSQLTDAWLVALARRREGKLATLDVSIVTLYTPTTHS